MTAREQAEELKRQAIDLLLKEREAIDAELKQLGYGQENATTPRRRGRPPKTMTLETGQEHQHRVECRVGPDPDLRTD